MSQSTPRDNLKSPSASLTQSPQSPRRNQSHVEFFESPQLASKLAKFTAQTKQSASSLIVDILENAGVEVIFGLPGESIAPLNNELLDRPNIRSVTTRHENSAVFAAAGYSLTSGKLGVVALTSGPGLLNAVTAIASAKCDGLPILILVGEVPRARQGHAALQDGSAHGLNILNVTRTLSKLSIEITDAARVGPILEHAIRTAQTARRGPVVVTLPMDVLMDSTPIPHIQLSSPGPSPLLPETVQLVAPVLSNTRRGLLLAGSGARQNGSSQSLIALAERLQWPVVTSPKGKGVFPTYHPLYLGVFGTAGHPSAQEYVAQGIDTLLALGTGLGDLTTSSACVALQPRNALIHVDSDALAFGLTYAPQLAIEATISLFCEGLLEALPPLEPEKQSRYHHRCDPDESALAIGRSNYASPSLVLSEIQQVLPKDTIYAIDSGDHYLYATHYLNIDYPDCYIAMSGLGSMGSSIGAVIGAKFAIPHRTVVAVIGDGCLAMSAAELSTAAANDLNIIVLVLNNQTLGMIENGANHLYNRSPDYSTQPMDVVNLSKSLGANAIAITNHAQIRELPKLLKSGSNRPIVLDVHIDPNIPPPSKGRISPLGDTD